MDTGRDDWDAHWTHYADAASRNPAQQMRHQGILAVLREGHSSDSPRIIDIGSGQGDLLVHMRAEFPTAPLVGVELSRSGVEISRQKVPDATVIEADLLRDCPQLRQFEDWATHAVCSEVLEHVDRPIELLSAARRYVAPGGLLVVTVPGGPMSAFDRHIGHRRHFARTSAKSIVEQAGFEVQRVRLAGFPFFNLYRLTVILRGRKLIRDVESGAAGGTGRMASLAMNAFRWLFRFNQSDSRCGWQVIVEARRDRTS